MKMSTHARNLMYHINQLSDYIELLEHTYNGARASNLPTRYLGKNISLKGIEALKEWRIQLRAKFEKIH